MKASVLGIGTELTDGQIVNKNAAWISKQLKAHGLTTSAHLVVPDEAALMRQGLAFCSQHSDLIFITGGLGPTSDDFTRDIVAEWIGSPLEFHEPSWQHVCNRLTSRGYRVQEIQRQQCYFPQGSEVLFNHFGTANAFTFEAHGKKVFVLPGPPREIEAVWSESITSWLVEKTRDLDPIVTRTWDTLGVGESDIAVIAEKVLMGVDVQKGYRVHLPYVEVKLTYPLSRETELTTSVERLSESLRFCTISRDGEDVAEKLSRLLQHHSSVCISDEISGAFLLHRLLPFLRDFDANSPWSFTQKHSDSASAELQLFVRKIDLWTCEVGLIRKGQTYRDQFISPYKTLNMQERRQQWFAERALIFWLQYLQGF
ncbi:MAG: competence/damage-inducible protein A [Bdellovibrio sp.]